MPDNFLDLDTKLARLKAAPQARYEDYKAFGTILRYLPDPIDFTRWCEAAVACHPTSEATYLGIADALAHAGMGCRARYLGHTRLAIALLERALTVLAPSERRGQIHSNLCFLYNEISRPDRAEHHGRLAKGHDNHLYHLWLSESLFAQNRFDPDPLCGIEMGVFRQESMQEMATEVATAWDAAPPPPTDDFTLLVSVDPVYFRKFALAQAINLHKLGSKVGLHYHIVNPDETSQALITVMRQRLPGLRLDFSFTRQPDLGTSSNRVYYSCARLLVARALMERENTNIVIADADVLFRTPPETLLAQTAGHDLATIHYLGEPMCNRYNASFFTIRRTLLGTYFLRVMEKFLYSTFDRGMIWMIDQLALYFCEQRVKKVTRGELRTLFWPEAVVAIHHYPLSDLWEAQPDAPIWSGATSAKWRDTPYTRLQNSLLREAGFNPDAL